jgi:hypothetical protein
VAEIRLEWMAWDLEEAELVTEERACGEPRHHEPNANRSYRGSSPVRNRGCGNGGGDAGEYPPVPIPKWTFPRFDGLESKICLRKCADYFMMYRVPEAV